MQMERSSCEVLKYGNVCFGELLGYANSVVHLGSLSMTAESSWKPTM